MNARSLLRRMLVPVGLLLLSAAASFAKSADDYFHGAAHLYVAGKIQEASVEAEEGLRLNPGDEKLRALAEQLRKMKDQQRGNQGQDGQSGKNDKDKQDGQNGKKSGDENQDKNRQGENGDKKSDRPDEKKNDTQKPEDGKDGERDGNPGKQPPRMSEAEAQRLLNSFADDEKKEQAERRKVIRARGGTEQDW